jgi:DNA-binding NarL/FixJ family response regulator
MKNNRQLAGQAGNKMRVDRAESRAQLAETRTAQARSRTELAETRTERAESRTESAKTRTEQAEVRAERAETRTEQVESTLQLLVHHEIDPAPKPSPRLLKRIPLTATTGRKSPLEQLTNRRREILQLIAQGQNTKQIAAILKVSPKTVEYHRVKLMTGLNIHDVPGLVRFAMRVGLIPQEC